MSPGFYQVSVSKRKSKSCVEIRSFTMKVLFVSDLTFRRAARADARADTQLTIQTSDNLLEPPVTVLLGRGPVFNGSPDSDWEKRKFRKMTML